LIKDIEEDKYIEGRIVFNKGKCKGKSLFLLN
jgi:hypothetical protein